MNDNSTSNETAGITVRREDLALEVRVGANALYFQMTPRAAFELARDLVTAALEHAAFRAEARLAMQELSDATARKAVQ